MTARPSRPSKLRGKRGREVRVKLAARDGARCFYCRTPFPSTDVATIDHFLPCALGPIHRRYNLVLACEPCNTGKGAVLPLGLLLVLRPLLHRDRLGLTA